MKLNTTKTIKAMSLNKCLKHLSTFLMIVTVPIFLNAGDLKIEKLKKPKHLPKLGVIRWDAFYNTPEDNPTSVPGYVAEALSPWKYRWRAPFYAHLDTNGVAYTGDKGKIKIDNHHEQRIADLHIKYAAEGASTTFHFFITPCPDLVRD